MTEILFYDKDNSKGMIIIKEEYVNISEENKEEIVNIIIKEMGSKGYIPKLKQSDKK